MLCHELPWCTRAGLRSRRPGSRRPRTPEEAKELHAELMKTFDRMIGPENPFTGRRDPARRPPGAVPVEFVLLGYPVLDAPPLPSGDGGDEDPDADPGG